MIPHPGINLESFTPRMRDVLRASLAVTYPYQVETNGVEPTEEPATDGGSNPPASMHYPHPPWPDDTQADWTQGVEMIPERDMIANFRDEAGRSDPILHLSEGRIDGGSTSRGRGHYIYMDPHSNLIAADVDGVLHRIGMFAGTRRTMQQDPGDGSCFLVNDDDHGVDWLNQLVDRVFNLLVGAHPTIRVPFAALRGAGINPDTIRIVHGDRNYRVSDNLWIPPFMHVTENHTNRHIAQFRMDEAYPQMGVEFSQWEGQWIWQVQLPNGQWVILTRTHAAQLDWAGGPHAWQATIPPSYIFWGTADNGRHQYISAYDHLENPPSYFLAQLPRAVTTLAEAFQLLQPPIVQTALAQNREVQRHGDVFFIRLNTSPTEWRDRRRDSRGRFASNRSESFVIYETGHTAERISVQESGATMVSGRIRHEPWLVDPSREHGDHRDLVLPRGWYLAVRNTVPA